MVVCFVSAMFFTFGLWFRLTIDNMVEASQKWMMALLSQDLKSIKLYASFGLAFLIVSFFILLLVAVFAWTPAAWKSRFLRRPPLFENPVLEVTPYKSVPSGTVGHTPRKVELNFLPDCHDLKVYDDDSTQVDRLPAFRLTRRQQNDFTPNDPEALISLRMALQMKESEKYDKAMKLFQHALALNPLHPDVLNHYGEFLELHEQDVIKADHMYTRALIVCPEHTKAIVNRQRTLPLVDELDEKQLKRIDTKRDHLIQIPQNDPALKRMKKEAYFQHIHHTVAIEGNTMTLAETRMVVETRMAVPGKSIIEHNEIIGLESALKFINNTLVNKLGYITTQDILHIHRRVLGHVDPIEAGSYRKSQVFVGEHTPPRASDIVDLMEDFVDWINSEDALKLHPVKHAALAHYKLVYIHPFVDGNGRTARLLMNLILMRAGYPPVIIRKQDRSLYYEYLQLANEGDVRPFVRFIAESTEGTLDVYLYATEYGIAGIRALEGQDGENNAKVIEMS